MGGESAIDAVDLRVDDVVCGYSRKIGFGIWARARVPRSEG